MNAQYENGALIKVELRDPATGVAESMLARVDHCDYEKHLVFAVLESPPFNNYSDDLWPGMELAIGFDKICEHEDNLILVG